MSSYKDAGVDVRAGEETVDRIKPMIRSTHSPRVLSDIGHFGGLFDASFEGYEQPVLVTSMDGVGTKLKVAFMTGVHNTVGHCLVNHCVNDILVCGAEPLYFTDYFATGKLEPGVAEKVIEGCVNGCRENGVALIGGETAEMPSMYSEGEYDMAGTIVGVVEKSRILTGSNVAAGDVLLGLPSSGLHTNGYSLARAVLFPEFAPDRHVDSLGTTVGDAMLAIHRSYLSQARPLMDNNLVKALAHITGGGIEGNTKRVVPEGLAMRIDWNVWDEPPIFDLIRSVGKIPDADMREAFNLGVGLVIIAAPEHVDAIKAQCPEAFEMGGIVAA